MTERKPHKWAEAIKAWADGKPIQYRCKGATFWLDEEFDGVTPLFELSDREWRIKPENIVIEGETAIYYGNVCSVKPGSKNNIRLEFDADTYKLVKAEVIG